MSQDEKVRTTLVLNQKDYARVARLRRKMEAASDTAVIREAIRRLAAQLLEPES